MSYNLYMKLNDVNIRIRNVTYRIIEGTMIKKDNHFKNNSDVEKKMRNFKPNEKISFKEIFGDKSYSTKEYYEEYLTYIKNGGYNNLSESEQLEFLDLIITDFAPSPWVLNDNLENLKNSLYWASESIYDFGDVLTLLFNERTNGNYENQLMWKMIFKELYSLIDRLRVEASIEISTRNMGLTRESYTPEIMAPVDKWRSRMPQDAILNGNATKLSKSIAYIKEFKVDEDGWVEFVYGDMNSVLSPYKNYLFWLMRNVRNDYEHSFSNRLFQHHYENGSISFFDANDVKIKKLSQILESKCFLVMVIYFYHLFKISEMYKEKLF